MFAATLALAIALRLEAASPRLRPRPRLGHRQAGYRPLHRCVDVESNPSEGRVFRPDLSTRPVDLERGFSEPYLSHSSEAACAVPG